MSKKVRARLMVRFFDRDTVKEARLRGLMKARAMVRRDKRGAIVVKNLLQGEKPTRRGNRGP